MEQIDNKKVIALASDHAGYELKQKLIKELNSQGYEVVDLGTNDESTSVNYADYGFKLAHYIKNHPDTKGIGICGTGLGISYALNRFSYIRAARVTNVQDAKLSKLHNDANVLVFGGRQITSEEAIEMFNKWEQTNFEGGRHLQRLKTLKEEGSND